VKAATVEAEVVEAEEEAAVAAAAAGRGHIFSR